MSKLFAAQQGALSEVVKHFTPNWFAVNMGTGITALCLAGFPGQPKLLYQLGLSLWTFNLVLFIFFVMLWLSSMIFYPQVHYRILKHEVSPLFLGCVPMALATIVNGCSVFAQPIFGDGAIHLAYALWWIDVGLSVLVALLVPYYMFTCQQHQLANMSAVWLLPFVACEVAAASGGLLMPKLAVTNALSVLATSYFLWGISLPLAFTILVIYFQRLVIHKIPGKEIAATVWLPLGPTATGVLGLLNLGEGAQSLLSSAGTQLSPLWIHFLSVLEGVDLVGAFIIIGFATWWALLAIILTLKYLIDGLPFNMTFWSFTFPLGVYCAAMLNLAKLTDWVLLTMYAGALTLALLVVWFIVAYRTLPGLYSGKLVKNPLIG